jgi:urea transport system ATP-binding protein
MMLAAADIDLYYGASHILRRAGITAERGKVTCLLGRNGVGKTSLLRAIFGLQPIRGGRILWDGNDIAGLKPHERARRGLALVPQGREIFPRLTVQENLETGFAPLPREKRRVSDEIFSLFPVLRDMLRRRGGDLSGGQQQQLAIARALVTGPQLLVLDEPTEGIQPSIIKDIERVIRDLAARGDMAILLVEQYFEFARALADTYVVMDRGEVVLSGLTRDMVEGDVRRYLTV